jgi:RNA polymerase sigma-70 factor (ECF subfamily)
MAGSGTEDFDAFYVAAVHRVVLYVYAACGDRAEAQAIAQEAFARAWQHWARVSGYDDPEAWVRMVAWRLTVNRWRGLRRRLAALARLGPSQEASASPSPDRVAVVGALQRLPRAQRRVVALYYLFDMPVGDIAESVGAPVGTVKAQLSRGRSTLAGLLGEKEVDGVNSAS